MPEVLKIILSSAGLFAFLVSIVQLALKWHENRTTIKKAKLEEGRLDSAEERQSERTYNAAVRRNIELHLEYDVTLRAEILQLRGLVNDLREDAGKEPIVFTAIPPAPPLFPVQQPSTT